MTKRKSAIRLAYDFAERLEGAPYDIRSRMAVTIVKKNRRPVVRVDSVHTDVWRYVGYKAIEEDLPYKITIDVVEVFF